MISRSFRQEDDGGNTHDKASQEEGATNDPALTERICKRSHHFVFRRSIWQILKSSIVRGGPGHGKFSSITWNLCEAGTEVSIQDCSENSQA